MCGRYASFQQSQDLLDAFLIDPTLPLTPELEEWRASWNVAPTQAVRIVVERAPRSETVVPGEEEIPVRSLRSARWGLVPGWAKDPAIGSRMINARSETASTKPSFRSAFKSRRCIIPADGYYEWHTEPGESKRPWFFHADDAPLAFAGLYEFWRNPQAADDAPDRWLVTCTILTAEAEGDLSHFHDRRPVVLPPDTWDAWLSPSTTVAEAEALVGVEPPDLTWHPVTTAVNSVANNGSGLITPDPAPAPGSPSGAPEALFPQPPG